MGKTKRENEIIFSQPLLEMRVIHTNKDEYDIEVAMLDGPSIGTTEPNEFIAQTITQGLLKAYTAKLKEVQEEMLKALSNISQTSEACMNSSSSADENQVDEPKELDT